MKDPKRLLAVHARVTVTLEIVAHSSWGAECTVEQVHKQGIEDVEGVLQRIRERVPDSGIKSITITKVDAVAISSERT